ncbi:MAG TPA: 2-succinyl-5-enolpyruvyl-6-hydroxy-3-cyclohexene-1-carboxylic-acid synthase [Polyangiaceae bacterium]|nr:2-succinyl-5-enolpyruvyl-6-hydroxy-3-cyclohexene-1-carboxylic-acid synthase [Polyangiaceae bacterium]
MSASPSSEAAPGVGDACLLGEWARLVLTTLQQSGIGDLWLSPGSRSTPFAWLAAHTPGITVRAVVDERAAAFLALGHARVSGRPSALLCTSGSAAANYFPAVVEASLSHLPLLVLTADRPLDVQHAAAAQTIDQLKLYGDYARRFYDLGVPDAAPSALLGARRALAQAVADARGPLPGPVHVNLRARKPLEPRAPRTEAEHALAAHVTSLLSRPLVRHAPAQVLANEAVLTAARALREAGSSALVVGPLPVSGKSLAQPIAELSRLTGAPIFAEASSQIRFALADEPLSFPLFDWLLSAPEAAQRHRPDLLLCVGATPTSSAFERWAAGVPRRLVLAEHGCPDALGSAELVASGDLHGAMTALVAEVERERRAHGQGQAQAWVPGLRQAHERCVTRVAEALSAPRELLSEGLAVKRVIESLPDGAVLALGNSLPIRDVDAYVTRGARLRVCAQRGANGIDGLVSGAIGSAIASGSPTLLLLGDVSLLHDLSGLANWRLAPSPLVIALIDNAGGRIFDQLPAQKLYGPEPEAAKLWHTAPDCDFPRAAAAFGLHYHAPTTPDAIQAATRDALERRGATLLHLRVGPTSAAELRQGVLSALGADLAGSNAGRS